MLKHGVIASSGHCVTFPQEINEPAQIFPRLPEEIKIIKVRKQGKTDTSKDFRVHRYTVQEALVWLKDNNSAYSDIIISQERKNLLHLNGDCEGIPTVEFDENTPILTIKALQMIKLTLVTIIIQLIPVFCYQIPQLIYKKKFKIQ